MSVGIRRGVFYDRFDGDTRVADLENLHRIADRAIDLKHIVGFHADAPVMYAGVEHEEFRTEDVLVEIDGNVWPDVAEGRHGPGKTARVLAQLLGRGETDGLRAELFLEDSRLDVLRGGRHDDVEFSLRV